MTDDRQTDHATEKCVGISGIADAARTIPPNNNNNAEKQLVRWRCAVCSANIRSMPLKAHGRFSVNSDQWVTTNDVICTHAELKSTGWKSSTCTTSPPFNALAYKDFIIKCIHGVIVAATGRRSCHLVYTRQRQPAAARIAPYIQRIMVKVTRRYLSTAKL